MLEVRGNAQGWAGDAYDLSVSAEHIPAERIVAFARHAKKDLPADLTATGEFEGVFAVRKQPRRHARLGKAADAPIFWRCSPAC